MYGHRAETPMLKGSSSARVVSEMATTAYFEAPYTEPPGFVHRPITDAVLDDVAVTPVLDRLLDDRHEGAHAVDDAVEVDAEHPLPVLLRRLVDRSARTHARVVADDVHAAEVVAHAVGHFRDLDSIAHVASIGTNVDVGRFEFRVGRGKGLGLYVEHGNVRTGPAERTRYAEADTGCRAGHHGDLVLNGFHCHSRVLSSA